MANTLPAVEYGDYSGSIYVKAVQALVGSVIDGKYGNNTRANVIAFQTTAGLETTGCISPNDWLALFDCEYMRTPKPTSSGTTSGTGAAQPVDYKQADKRWGLKSYTVTGSAKQTIASSGCGPTSMADIMATWIDKSITPVEMCAYALAHGFRTKNSGTAWDFFKSVAGAYGFSKFVQTKSMATAKAAIMAGALVVASMGPGYWTRGGHFICLWKCDDSYMYANDPASTVRKKQKLSAFESQRKQFFDVADEDEEDDDDDEYESVTPEQTAKLCELLKELHDIQSRLVNLAKEVDDEAASEAIADAASSVDDAMDSLEEIIEGEINIDIVVDGKTSTAGIIKLAEMLK